MKFATTCGSFSKVCFDACGVGLMIGVTDFSELLINNSYEPYIYYGGAIKQS